MEARSAGGWEVRVPVPVRPNFFSLRILSSLKAPTNAEQAFKGSDQRRTSIQWLRPTPNKYLKAPNKYLKAPNHAEQVFKGSDQRRTSI